MALAQAFNIVVFTSLLTASLAGAQTSAGNTLSAPQGSSVTNPYSPQLVLGLKSYNTSGRAKDYNDPSGRTYKGKQEVFVGAKTKSGWGGQLQGVQTRSQYKDSNKDRWSTGDPSITLSHPAWHDSAGLRISGQLRTYFPASENSRIYNTRQTAYYLNISGKLNETTDIFNSTVPRYFSQNTYLPNQTTTYIEDRTTVSQKSGKLRYGIGQWTQIENHRETPQGISVEIYPYADYIIEKNLFFGPRLSMPVYIQGSVYEGAKAVSTDNAYLELFLEATL